MTVQTFLPLLAAFFLGCIANKIPWVAMLRRFRRLLGFDETTRIYAGAGMPGNSPGEDAPQSLLNLQQHLTAAAQASPARNRDDIAKT